MDNHLSKTRTIDEFTSSFFTTYYHRLSPQTSDEEGKKQSISRWIAYLDISTVRSILTTLSTSNNLSLPETSDEDRLLLLLATHSLLQLYVVDNFVCFLDREQLPDYGQLLDFLAPLVAKDSLEDLGEVVVPVGKIACICLSRLFIFCLFY